MRNKQTTKMASCLCGGVTFEVIGKLRHVINCHCSQCMKTHGNYGAYTECSEDNITFTDNKTLKWYKSSNFAKRGFCSNCGASIFYKPLQSDKVCVSAGMFNNPTKLQTHSNIYIKGKLDFYRLDTRLRNFHGNGLKLE